MANADKKRKLKDLIRRLHQGEDISQIKKEFRELLKETTAEDISKVEEELINEGMSIEELHKLCNIHLEAFKESIEKQTIETEPGHPLNILMNEHRIILNLVDNLRRITKDPENELIKDTINELKDSSSHYIREENVLFPTLEKYDVVHPPKIMWSEHNQIRAIEKNLFALLEEPKKNDFVRKLEDLTIALAELLSNHFYKENNILFPTALKVIPEEEWPRIRKEFDDLGYCCFTPKIEVITMAQDTAVANPSPAGKISLEIGELSPEEIKHIFNTLPVDITFVDREDSVRYFNQSKERIFPRTASIIGRKVQNCHPQKSVHIVNRIINDFKSGKRDVARFWLELNNRLVYIQYFAVRNKNREYLGVLEVTQDITEIKKITGEKRLLEDE